MGKEVKSFTINSVTRHNSIPRSDIEEDDDYNPDDYYSYPSPPLRTPFASKTNQQAMFVDNSRKDIPYPEEVSLSRARRCNTIVIPDTSQPQQPKKTSVFHVTSRDIEVYAMASLASWIFSLIDSGANGYVCGRDMRRMDEPSENDRKVHITGVGNHWINDKPVGKFGAVARCNLGKRLVVVYEGADVPEQPTTIHSAAQLRHYDVIVDDVPYCKGGRQRLTLLTGEIFPLSIKNGLAYLPMRLPTDEQLATMPQCILTSDKVWDPSQYTDTFSIEDQLKNLPNRPPGTDVTYDEYGELIGELNFLAKIDNVPVTATLPKNSDISENFSQNCEVISNRANILNRANFKLISNHDKILSRDKILSSNLGSPKSQLLPVTTKWGAAESKEGDPENNKFSFSTSGPKRWTPHRRQKERVWRDQ